jgi:hypothetical protein
MTALITCKAPKAPVEFPLVVRLAEPSRLDQVRTRCAIHFGPMQSRTIHGVWYEANGYFFFRSHSLVLEFKLLCNVVPMNQMEPSLPRLYERLLAEFGE